MADSAKPSPPPRRAWWRPADFQARSVAPRMPLGSAVLVVAVIAAWSVALLGADPRALNGELKSIASWATECPQCGTVESVATLSVKSDPAGIVPPYYRLTIRMADGTMRMMERLDPLAPGLRVRVNGNHVHPESGTGSGSRS